MRKLFAKEPKEPRHRFGQRSNQLRTAGLSQLVLSPFYGMSALVGVGREVGSTAGVIVGAGILVVALLIGLIPLHIRSRSYTQFDDVTRSFVVRTLRTSNQVGYDGLEFALPQSPEFFPAPVRYRTRGGRWETCQFLGQCPFRTPVGLLRFEQALKERSIPFTWS